MTSLQRLGGPIRAWARALCQEGQSSNSWLGLRGSREHLGGVWPLAGGGLQTSGAYVPGGRAYSASVTLKDGRGGAEREKLWDNFNKLQANITALTADEENVAPGTVDPNGVFVNHSVRLDQIKVYGFDYDYTLAHYSAALHPLIYRFARETLVREHKYPPSLLDIDYDPSFPIRGLHYDRRNGCLLKLDYFHCIERGTAHVGRRRLSWPEVEALYGGARISADHLPHLVSLMDLFCLPEVCLLCDVVQHLTDRAADFDAGYVYEDVHNAVQLAHRSGALHAAVLADPNKYLLYPAQELVEGLRRLHADGKKLFLLTNSGFPFVDGGMRFLFQDDGRGGASWRDLFHLVCALGDKPNFYTSERPFRQFVPATGELRWTSVRSFSPGGVYYHGSLKEFLRFTGWHGRQVLYCGDHVFGDLRGPSKAGWRTAAIVRELESEIRVMNTPRYRRLQGHFHALQELLGRYHALPPPPQQTGVAPTASRGCELLRTLQTTRQSVREHMRQAFQSSFGSVLLTDRATESAFAYNLQRYADVYTSRAENLLRAESPSGAWLYAPFDVKVLPHHVKVPPTEVMSP